jgi:tetratricopeptide (TPR) repeat protein
MNLDFSNPDIYYQLAEEQAQLAEYYYKRRSCGEAIKTMQAAIKVLERYVEIAGPDTLFDFEIGMYKADLSFYCANAYSEERRYYMAKTEASAALYDLKMLNVPDVHNCQKAFSRRKKRLHDAHEMAEGRLESGVSEYDALSNKRDIAVLEEDDEKAQEITRLMESFPEHYSF